MSQTAPEADAGAIPQEHGQASVDPTTPVDSPPPPGLLPAAAASEPSQQGTRNRTQLAAARLVGSAPAHEARQLVITINSVLPAPAQRR